MNMNVVLQSNREKPVGIPDATAGVKMSNALVEEREASVLSDLDRMIDQSVDSMSAGDLNKLEVKRKATMAKHDHPSKSLAGPREICEQEKPVLQA